MNNGIIILILALLVAGGVYYYQTHRGHGMTMSKDNDSVSIKVQ